MSYTDLVQLYASGAEVKHAFFVQFNFKSETSRVWNGFRNIEIGGQLWSPAGPLATVEEIEDAITDQQPTIEFKISGVEADLLALALAETDEVRGQVAFVYDCFFDADWQPVTPLESYAVVLMDTVKIGRQPASGGTWDRTITVPAQGLLTNGANPPAGRYSTADQAIRYPDKVDDYFEFILQLQNKAIRWPTF